ncbi:hypothetical protein GCM10009799_20930 [Nocardiopsis rhodophaea]|uniref:Uncharacterized protein n=1 Tax=Nocardiopsis rhodophaea TaxID=280238 RepID=A0ABN2SZ63_9ACTN
MPGTTSRDDHGDNPGKPDRTGTVPMIIAGNLRQSAPRPAKPARGPAPPAPTALGAAFHHRTPDQQNADKAAQQTQATAGPVWPLRGEPRRQQTASRQPGSA